MNDANTEVDPRDGLARARLRTHLRDRMKALRQALPDAERNVRSARCVERLQHVLASRNQEVWALYAACRGEVDLSSLLASRDAQGVTTLLPRAGANGDLSFASNRCASLVVGAFGITEPGPDAPAVDSSKVGVVIVPALALDPNGRRLGWGKGYYDRWLATAHHVIKVGVVFDFQLVCELPAEAHDVSVDFVVTDERMLECGKGT